MKTTDGGSQTASIIEADAIASVSEREDGEQLRIQLAEKHKVEDSVVNELTSVQDIVSVKLIDLP